MKSSFKLFFAAALAVAGVLAVSCNKDKTPDDPNYNKNEAKTIAQWAKEGIEVDMQSHIVEMNVKADGQWRAVADPDETWMDLSDNALAYNGSRQILLVVEENFTEVDRRSAIYVEDSKGEFYEIPVRQNYNFNGEPPTNSSAQAFANVGIGYGVDYDYVMDTRSIAKRNALEDAKVANGQMKEEDKTQFSPTKVKKNNPIFSIKSIERLMSAKEGKLSEQAYVENEIPFVDLYAQLMDSTVCQSKHLEVSLELGVSFGCIEFAAAGEYTSDATDERQRLDYTIIRNSPIYNAAIAEAEIAKYANESIFDVEDDPEYETKVAEIEALINKYTRNGTKTMTGYQQKIIDGMWDKLDTPNMEVFSPSFGQLYWEFFKAVANGDNKKTAAALNKIDSFYGPFYISGGDFGGAMTIHAVVKNMSMEGFAEISGTLDANMGGAFNVSGSFVYNEDGMQILRDANARFYIYGGDANGTSDRLTSIMLGDDPTNRDAWTEALTRWIQTMYSDNEHVDLSMAAPISFTITPIWNLFWDEDMQMTAQEWFLEKYKDRGIYDWFGIMNGEHYGAEEILRRAQEYLE